MIEGLLAVPVAGVLALTGWTLVQKEHAILRRFGPVGFIRYGMEWMRPKNHQYQEGPGDGRPYPLVKRSQVYRASKGLDDTEGFGTTKDLHLPGTHTGAPAHFARDAALVGLPTDCYGRTFKTRSGVFTIRDINLRAHEYPVLATRDDGKKFKFNETEVLRLLNA